MNGTNKIRIENNEIESQNDGTTIDKVDASELTVDGSRLTVNGPSTFTISGTTIAKVDASGLTVDADAIFISAPGGVTLDQTLRSASDNRIKHNEQPITNALENIRMLKGFKYFKTPNKLYEPNTNFSLDGRYNMTTFL